MKILPIIAATALIGLALPAAVQAAPAAGPASTLSDFSSVTVFSAPNDDGLLLHRNPSLGSDPRVADAITRAGYTGAQIMGYNLDGTSLTVYVKSS